jgi:hypothetical protein
VKYPTGSDEFHARLRIADSIDKADMPYRTSDRFPTIRTEGSILPADLLLRVSAGDGNLPGLTPAAYHLLEGEKLNEATNRAWNRLLGVWASFQKAVEKLPDKNGGTSVTRDRWLLPFWQELGYGRLTAAAPVASRPVPCRISKAASLRTWTFWNRFVPLPSQAMATRCGRSITAISDLRNWAAFTSRCWNCTRFSTPKPLHLS